MQLHCEIEGNNPHLKEGHHIVGAGMSLFPLHQEQLGHHQSSNKDEDHFSMHGFMAAMLGMHACVLDPWWESVSGNSGFLRPQNLFPGFGRRKSGASGQKAEK